MPEEETSQPATGGSGAAGANGGPDEHPAESAVESVASAATAVAGAVAPTAMDLPEFSPAASTAAPKGMELLDDVKLRVTIELGRSRMFVEDVLKLVRDSVIELDKAAGDPVDIYVNDRPIARGEVLVLNDNFCVRVSEILDPSIVESA